MTKKELEAYKSIKEKIRERVKSMEAKELMVGDYIINTEFEKNEVDTIEIVEPTRVWLTHGKTYIPMPLHLLSSTFTNYNMH